MEVAMKKRYSIVKEQNPQRETTAKRFSSTANHQSLTPGPPTTPCTARTFLDES
jgi:hypothetical protein